MTAPALSSETNLTQEVSVDALPEQASLEDLFEIESTCAKIEEYNFGCIALQFPDELLPQSVLVYQRMRARLSPAREIYVLADTTYGSCCVDEIAAQHVSADVIVHYGHSCLSHPARLPCILVFTKHLVDVGALQAAFKEFMQKSPEICKDKSRLELFFDVGIEWKISEIIEALQPSGPIPISCRTIDKSSYLNIEARPASAMENGHSKPIAKEDSLTLPLDSVLLYLGKTSLALTHLLLRNPSIPAFCCDPTTRSMTFEAPTIHARKLLMRRYAAIQKARDADVFGIVVGTLGIARYLPLLDRIKAILKRKQKKIYTLCVGKPTPAKLANYQEIECFVLVACPENSLLLTSPESSREFYRTIISPWEMEVALEHGKAWEDGWRVGWDTLANPLETDQGAMEGDEDLQFSHSSGKLRTVRKFGPSAGTANVSDEMQNLALQTREESDRQVAKIMGSAAGEHLSTLHYRGLDPQWEKSAPAQLEQGRKGVARGYTAER